MSVVQWLVTLPRKALIFVIELYRTWVSPTRMPTCRFEPTCSTYAVEALETHGFVWGSVLSTWRLLKCGPWHKPGYDPVPEKGAWRRRRDRDPMTSRSDSPPEGERALTDRGQ
ncbi:membrane protein insertion efficiency factor YidD [Gordonia sp. (in: high G+C Gram-positive bacteria)]|uniref:membrane protein insertion efficiency factor YidD n=1 Tax=Gordonia sp. (in: high G+C Gram-positive bacteria) TaxID=84139 RepID=UPI00352760C5